MYGYRPHDFLTRVMFPAEIRQVANKSLIYFPKAVYTTFHTLTTIILTADYGHARPGETIIISCIHWQFKKNL
jgi:hypothetical protein